MRNAPLSRARTQIGTLRERADELDQRIARAEKQLKLLIWFVSGELLVLAVVILTLMVAR